MINQYSIVGVGRHVLKKIIPSIENSKCIIQSLFSSKKHKFRTYNNLKKFINLIPKKNIFYISSPPHIHFEQSKIILKNNFNILCEKPSFLNLQNFNYIKKIILKKKLFFIEIIIFRYTLMWKYFFKVWKNRKSQIKKIEINFLIPGFGSQGFRKKKYDWSTCLYDIGIYPIALLNLLNIKNYKIDIKKIIFKKNLIIKKIIFSVINQKHNFIITIGEDSTYRNNVVLYDNKKGKIDFEFFFYGLKKNKKVKSNDKLKIIKDVNSFEIIFQKGKNFWLQHRLSELKYIYKNLLFLKKVEKKILTYKSY